MPFRVERMTVNDVSEVMTIEREAFAAPWPSSTYRHELQVNPKAHYLVVRCPPELRYRESPPLDSGHDLSYMTDRLTDRTDNGATPRRSLSATLLRFTSKLLGNDVPAPPDQVTLAGYAGLWLMVDEAHVTTIATRPRFRGRGLGELLLVELSEVAMRIGAKWLTLEVRVSNEVAQNLYKKYGFKATGMRHKYYSDNNEDALIMWTEELSTPAFRDRFVANRQKLYDRLMASGDLPRGSVPRPLP